MARRSRRLILWFLAGTASLAALALLAVVALLWFIDPNDYRTQIESRASAAIGRPVHLTGTLRWQLGRQIFIVSEGGEIANAAGFGPGPLARWSRIRLGVAARPLFSRRVLMDRVAIDGLQLQLQRNAQGAVNWDLQMAGADDSAEQSVVVRIAAVELRDATVRYQAAAGADWRATGVVASAKLPEDLGSPQRVFRDVDLAGRIAGGPLAAQGVAFAVQAQAVQLAPQQLQVPKFSIRWADATLAGSAMAEAGDSPAATASLTLQAPSLRTLLATVNAAPPPMRDPATLGKLELSATLHHARGATSLEGLSMSLDDTQLTGAASLPRLEPLALRFDLVADKVDLDRYREPDDAKSEPLELPLAKLKALDAKGTLRIREARLVGAAAKEIRIDVE